MIQNQNFSITLQVFFPKKELISEISELFRISTSQSTDNESQRKANVCWCRKQSAYFILYTILFHYYFAVLDLRRDGSIVLFYFVLRLFFFFYN